MNLDASLVDQDGSETLTARIKETGDELRLVVEANDNEREILVAGGLLSYLRRDGGNPPSG